MENGDSRACKVIRYSEIAKNFICIKYKFEKLYRPIQSCIINETKIGTTIKIIGDIPKKKGDQRTFIILIDKNNNCKELE